MGTLYENIKALCDAKGIKPGRMCVDTGLSKGLISDLKVGRKKSVKIETAKKIADYFGVPVDAVTGDLAGLDRILEENKKSPTGQEADEAKSIDYLLSKMTPAELAELMGKVAQELKERGLE